MKKNSKTNNKGITLIALIITIIVMIILVGVTVNISLNGGIFDKAKKATYQTEASMIKEQLEIAKAVEIANNGGNLLDDYSIITVDSLNIDEKIINKYKDKILVNASGDILYNPDAVADEEGTWLQEIGINPNTTKVRVPFTNYIENGNNYYTYGTPVSMVAVFSKGKEFTVYTILSDGTLSSNRQKYAFEIIDKNDAPYDKEAIIGAAEVETFDEVGDDIMTWEQGANLFKANYTKVIIGQEWYTLDTSYTLPTT